MIDITARMTLLVDNESPLDLFSEHGFSAWIEAGGQRIVFDTGQGMSLDENARRLVIDFSQATALVLSHGHYNHTGGVSGFLTVNANAPVMFGRGLTDLRFSCHPDQAPRANGMGASFLCAVNALPAPRRVEVKAPRYLAPSIGISGPIPRLTSFEDTGGPFFLDEVQQHPDIIGDELAMWFETDKGLVILTGCCHAGLVNSLEHIRKISGIERVHGIVGDLHLLQASTHRLEQTVRFIADCAPGFLAPRHCTGQHVVEQLRQVFGANLVQPGQSGKTYEIGALTGEH